MDLKSVFFFNSCNRFEPNRMIESGDTIETMKFNDFVSYYTNKSVLSKSIANPYRTNFRIEWLERVSFSLIPAVGFDKIVRQV